MKIEPSELTLLDAYELGIDDGLMNGSEVALQEGLIGEEGIATTALRPSGTARIAGKRVDVTAVGEFLEEGAAITVVAADGLRVAVRRKDKLEPATPSV